MIQPDLQETLFPISKESALSEVGRKESIVQDWYVMKFLSFDITELTELTAPQYLELTFIDALFEKAIQRDNTQYYLSKLKFPYSYDYRKVYFDVFKNEWKYLPVVKDLTDYDAEEIIDCYLEAFSDDEKDDVIDELIEDLKNKKSDKE